MKAKEELIRAEHRGAGPNDPVWSDAAAAILRGFATIELAEHGRAGRRREYRSEQVAALLAHARAHSPFWRSRLPASARSLDGLPILTRTDLRSQVASEGALPLPHSHGAAGLNSTSGATSEPVRFYVSDLSAHANAARYCFDDLTSGRRLDLPLSVCTAKVAAAEARDRWPTRTGEIWRTGPGMLLPLRADEMETTVARLLDGAGGHLVIRPPVLEALVVRARAQAGSVPSFADIMTYGEVVPPALREEVRAVLGTTIVDRYSAEEIGPIAFECRRRPAHYHVATSLVAVEAVDARRRPVEGKPGDLLLTGLLNFASPVIRYDIGDRGTLLPRCPCGHDGPTLRDLVGRRRSLLRLPDGRMFFLHVRARDLTPVAPVAQWRVLQTGQTDLVMELVAPRLLTREECDGLAQVMRGATSPSFAVTVRQVPAIDWGPSGKRQLVVNMLDDARR